MDKIISFKRYICGYEEFNFPELYKNCDLTAKKLPINVFKTEHKNYGTILINTGCSELLKNNPVSFAKFIARNQITFTDEDSIVNRLAEDKLDPRIVKKVLLTHCDPQCCGGLKLLPRYELRSTARVLTLAILSDPSDGIIASVMPDMDVPKKAAGIFEGKSFLSDYFKWVFDIFGDGTILAVDLPGHAKAMTGFFLTEKNIFIAGDASIDASAIENDLTPTQKLLKNQCYPQDYKETLSTLKKIKTEHPEIQFLFTHSENAAEIS